MKYFRSYRDATAYCKNSGSSEKPAKVNVWLDMSWTKVWAVRTAESGCDNSREESGETATD